MFVRKTVPDMPSLCVMEEDNLLSPDAFLKRVTPSVHWTLRRRDATMRLEVDLAPHFLGELEERNCHVRVTERALKMQFVQTSVFEKDEQVIKF